MNLKFPYTLSDIYESANKKRFTVISTFSGGGGSSIGYKLAGGDVLLANEFVETASNTYKANFPDTPVLCGDIKTLNGSDFLTAANLKVGELDVLDGSPPCSAFSTAGKKSKGWNKEKKYSDDKIVTNIEDLFFEFLRVANEIKPKIIIAENVEGIQFAESRKKFNHILNTFSSIGYTSTFETINARDFGVAQNRPRTIFVGVRNDIFEKSGDFFPNNFFPNKLKGPEFTIREAFKGLIQTEEEIQEAIDIVKSESAVNKVMQSFPKENLTAKCMNIEYASKELTKNHTAFFGMRKQSFESVSNCLTATVTMSGNIHPSENRKFSLKESYRLMALPDDYKNTGTYVQQLERVGRMHSPFPVAHIADHIVRTYLGK